ncbi:MAG: methyltransferase domain-containing protein [Balneolaceae bacterium]
MFPNLQQRAEQLTERMDDPDADRELLFNTYRQFADLNRKISRWKTLFKAWIAPLSRTGKPLRILDIGCGGGDLCLNFAEWALESGIEVQVSGIDPDPRAFEYLQQLSTPANVEFRQCEASDLIGYGEIYDVVVSNHLLHHLKNEEIYPFSVAAESLARKLILFNDIRRNRTGFAAFALTAPWLYSSSYIVRDGFTSIRRSFTRNELQRMLPEGWVVKKLIPSRLLAIREFS